MSSQSDVAAALIVVVLLALCVWVLVLVARGVPNGPDTWRRWMVRIGTGYETKESGIWTYLVQPDAPWRLESVFGPAKTQVLEISVNGIRSNSLPEWLHPGECMEVKAHGPVSLVVAAERRPLGNALEL